MIGSRTLRSGTMAAALLLALGCQEPKLGTVVTPMGRPVPAVEPVAAVPAPPTGPVTGPARIRPGERNLRASVPAQPGCTYQWTIEGGTLVGGAGGPAISFDAGPGPKVVLACRVVNAAGAGLRTSLEIPMAGGVTLAVNPATAVITAGGRLKVGYTLEGGRTGEVDWRVLEPGGGSVDAAGVYRAPALPGGYTVQVASREEPGVKASLAVRVVAMPSGAILGPSRVVAGAKGLKASVPEQPGCMYQWKIEGCDGMAGGSAPTVTFNAGPGPKLILQCDITNEAGDTYTAKLEVPVATQ